MSKKRKYTKEQRLEILKISEEEGGWVFLILPSPHGRRNTQRVVNRH